MLKYFYLHGLSSSVFSNTVITNSKKFHLFNLACKAQAKIFNSELIPNYEFPRVQAIYIVFYYFYLSLLDMYCAPCICVI